MRTKWIAVLAIALIGLMALSAPSALAASKFEVYANVGYANVSTKLKPKGADDIKITSPGLALSAGARYWFSSAMGAGVMLDRVQATFEYKDGGTKEKSEASTTGILATFSYRFMNTERAQLLGTLGAGSFTAKVKNLFGADETKGKSAFGYLAALELRSALSERTNLTGQLGYRFVNFSKVERDGKEVPDLKLDASAFSLGVGLSYAF